jgi:prophage antirepressor-like protein
MNKIIPLLFKHHEKKHEVRAIIIDDEEHFVGKDVCSALGYADSTTAIRSHCRGVQKLHPISDSLGRTQETRVLTEADVLRLIVNSTLPAAVAFERWVFEEVLPSIRRTGGFQTLSTQPVARKFEVELAVAEAFFRSSNVSPAGKLGILAHITTNNGGDPAFLPAYAVDAASDSTTGSSMKTQPLTALLNTHGIRMSASVYNQLLQDAGMIDQLSRRTTSKRYPAGVKTYWAVTDAGLAFGKNVTAPGNPRETQPHWYVDRFAELHAQVAGRLDSEVKRGA